MKWRIYNYMGGLDGCIHGFLGILGFNIIFPALCSILAYPQGHREGKFGCISSWIWIGSRLHLVDLDFLFSLCHLCRVIASAFVYLSQSRTSLSA
jgi:hypothetical protein